MEEVGNWSIENDTVMGGASDSTITHQETEEGDSMKFAGHVSLENNGGFAQTTHLYVSGQDISAASGIVVRGHGDEKKYKLRLETDTEKVSYSHEFIAGESFECTLQLSDFKKVHHGKEVPDKPDLNKENIKSISILIGNGKEEDFTISLMELTTIS